VTPTFVPAVQVSARPGAWISAGWRIVTADMGNYVVLALIFIVLNAIVPIILQGPLIVGFHIYTMKRILGRQGEIGDIFKGFNFFVPALVASLAIMLFTGLGTLLCVIPGSYFYVAFSVAVPVLLVEGAGPSRALGRSRELVKGRRWGTCGVAVVGYLLVSIVSLALTGLVVGVAFANPARNTVTGFALNTLAGTIGSMIATPAAAAFITVLYIDLRVRKEGFDLLLLARRLGVERAPGQELPSFLPEPAPAGSQPPFWPPPPGWVPGPALPEPPPPPSDEPPFWPPPPGWKPGDR